MKKIKLILCIVTLIAVGILGYQFAIKQVVTAKTPTEQKVENYVENDIEAQRLEKELEERIEKSRNFIESQSFDPQIILRETTGSYELTLDLTNNSNKVTEFFTSSLVKYKFDYLTNLVYPFENMERFIDEEGFSEFVYDKSDIFLKPVTITKTKLDDSEETGIFREKQDKNYLVSMTEVAKDNIATLATTENSYKYAELSLRRLLILSAKDYNIEKIVINGELIEVTDTTISSIETQLNSLEETIKNYNKNNSSETLTNEEDI